MKLDDLNEDVLRIIMLYLPNKDRINLAFTSQRLLSCYLLNFKSFFVEDFKYLPNDLFLPSWLILSLMHSEDFKLRLFAANHLMNKPRNKLSSKINDALHAMLNHDVDRLVRIAAANALYVHYNYSENLEEVLLECLHFEGSAEVRLNALKAFKKWSYINDKLLECLNSAIKSDVSLNQESEWIKNIYKYCDVLNHGSSSNKLRIIYNSDYEKCPLTEKLQTILYHIH